MVSAVEEWGQRAANDGFALLGDQPYLGEWDPLGFDRIADELARLILESRGSTPFTLGIEAAWGMGKSTLMSRLCARLSTADGVESTIFNAWTADDGRALEALVKTVLNELDPNALRRALRNERLIGGFRFLTGLLAGIFGLGNVVDTVWEKAVADPRARNDLRDLVEQAVDRWRRTGSELEGGRMLCVFVDDLDRCSPRGVLEVFEAMKLYLDVPGIVFVVGYDQDIVSDLVLQEKGYSSEAIESRDYLEKFIQIVYRIPRAAPDRSEALARRLFRQSGTAELLGETEREIVIEGSESNPRRIKRFVNAFVLAHGLDPRWRDFEPQELIRVQLLQMYFRDFAEMLERPAERDPIKEFLRYRKLREALRRHDAAERSEIQQMLDQIGLAAGDSENYGAVLSRLDDHVPPVYKRLAGHEEFAALVRSLSRARAWPQLRAALERGELPPSGAGPPATGKGATSGTRAAEWLLQELRVLLAVDDYRRQEHVEESLWKYGASLNVGRIDPKNLTLARRDGQFDVAVFAVSHDRDPSLALDAIQVWRRGSTAVPPLYLLARQVSPVAEVRARALAVDVVPDVGVLRDRLEPLAQLRQLALSMRPYERKS